MRRRLRGSWQRLVADIWLYAVVRKTGNFGDVTWLGHPVWQNVADLWVIQEAISEVRPALLIETGTNRGGSSLFYAHLFDLLGRGRVITVDVEKMHNLSHPRVQYVIGSSVNAEVLEEMREAVSAADGPVMVILDSDHAQLHVAAELDAYAPFVSLGSILLVQDGIIDVHPYFRKDRPGPFPAIHEFLAGHPEFGLDTKLNRRFVATHHPDGWLRRRHP